MMQYISFSQVREAMYRNLLLLQKTFVLHYLCDDILLRYCVLSKKDVFHMYLIYVCFLICHVLYDVLSMSSSRLYCWRSASRFSWHSPNPDLSIGLPDGPQVQSPVLVLYTNRGNVWHCSVMETHFKEVLKHSPCICVASRSSLELIV